MTSSLDRSVNIKQYLRVVWRRKGVILLCWLLCVSSTLVALEFVPRIYESEATLMIEDSQLLSNELEKIRGGIMETPERYGMDQARMAKMVGRIRSRPFLERVIRILKMQEDPAVRARAADELKKRSPGVSVDEMAIRMLVENLQARIRFGSSGQGIYKVTVADYSADNAQLLAKWITEIFVDASNQRNIDLIKSAHTFGAEQLRIYEQRLQQSEDALERYQQSLIQRDLGLSTVRPENLTYAESFSRKVEDEAAMTRVRLKEYGENVASLGLEDHSGAVFGSPKVRELSTGLKSALTNEIMNRLGAPVGDLGAWPPQGAYASIRRNLLHQVELEVAAYYVDASADQVAAVAKYLFSQLDLDAQKTAADALQASMDRSKQRVESRPGGEIELARLGAEVETNRKLLQSFQSQMVASDVSRAVEITKLGMQIEILDPANRPLVPTAPKRMKIILASLLLGPVLGAGMAFLGDAADTTLRSLDDFARVVPEPILGTTPLFSPLVSRRPWLRRHWVPASVALVLVLAAAAYAVKDQLLLHVWTKGTPVNVVSPDKDTSENQR